MIKQRLKQLLQWREVPSKEWTMRAALTRAGSIHVASVIDVGASDGMWSRLAREIWPSARYLLIEAQPVHRAALEKGEFDYVLAAAGDGPGTTHFNAEDPFGGWAHQQATGLNDIVVPMTTIDIEVAQRGLVGPFLIKLDTHGFEREILDGAAATIRDASLLVIEAYNFELRPGSLRFHELCGLLESAGFRPVDLADPMHRPYDGSFWQVDMIFARSSEARFAHIAYQ